MPDEVDTASFEAFFRRVEPRLRLALAATVGPEAARVLAADALSYAWENWQRVAAMDNPIGYLYVLGRNRGRRHLRGRLQPLLPPIDPDRTPWIEPDLPTALASLPEQQRVVVMLLHCFQWTLAEVAALLGVSKSTVQTHADRGMIRLRARMGVTL